MKKKCRKESVSSPLCRTFSAIAKIFCFHTLKSESKWDQQINDKNHKFSISLEFETIHDSYGKMTVVKIGDFIDGESHSFPQRNCLGGCRTAFCSWHSPSPQSFFCHTKHGTFKTSKYISPTFLAVSVFATFKHR